MIYSANYLQLFDALAALRKLDADYPEAMKQARREAFVEQIRKSPLEARLAAIDAALPELQDMETVNNLLEEKADILNQLERN